MEITNDHPISTEPLTESLYAEPSTAESDLNGAARPLLVINAEILLYAALLIVVVVTHLINLGQFPLNSSESREALAVYRAITPNAAGNAITPSQPLNFAANLLALTFTGGDENAARLATTIVGGLVVLLPLLYRRWLGASRTMIVALLLAFSPVLFAASRTLSGTPWAFALVLIGGWCIGRFVESARAAYAIGAVTVVAMLVLMTEPAGFVFAVMLGVGVSFAVWHSDDDVGTYRDTAQTAWRAIPWVRAAGVAAVAVIGVGSAFLLFPVGLAGLGEVIGRAFSGFVTRPVDNPFAYPVLLSFLSEPALWIFGTIGILIVLDDDFDEADSTATAARFIGRVLIGMLVIAFGFGVLYAGSSAEHALWLTLPLAGLSLFAVEKLFSPIRDRMFMPPQWGIAVYALIAAATLFITGIHLVVLGRGMLAIGTDKLAPGVELAPGVGGQFNEFIVLILVLTASVVVFAVLRALLRQVREFSAVPFVIAAMVFVFLFIRAILPIFGQDLSIGVDPTQVQNWLRASLMIGFSLAIFIVGFFLVGSMWGNGAAARGIGLGALAFLTITGLSNGWRTSVTDRDDAANLWTLSAPSRNLKLVETKLAEASWRSVGTNYDIDVTVQLPVGADDTGPLAWSLRRFWKTQFVTSLEGGINTRAVIAPLTEPEPQLGATYVGQKFAQRNFWDSQSLLLVDTVPWLANHQTRKPPSPTEGMILYLRSDVYRTDGGTAP